ALVHAVRIVTGLDTSLDGIATSGMLDRDLIRLMMTAAGAERSAIDDAMPRIVREAQAAYCKFRPDLRRKVCPGVRSALSILNRRGIPLGLVTGNLTSIGWKKMEHSGLLSYFRFGAFAEQASTRAGLVGIAMRHARRAGWLRRDTPVSLVGDHPNDIRAAKLNGIRSVAVATGVVRKAELAAHAPDVLLPDLRCLRIATFL
ncbi:MAG: HAD hydrolase-like protein, partial [Bryobacteraceae bacterium]|nr:HAD hydrolase-like protein [Bryobacteraceae bacterium]